ALCERILGADGLLPEQSPHLFIDLPGAELLDADTTLLQIGFRNEDPVTRGVARQRHQSPHPEHPPRKFAHIAQLPGPGRTRQVRDQRRVRPGEVVDELVDGTIVGKTYWSLEMVRFVNLSSHQI